MNLTNKQEARLALMQASMKKAELYAMYWVAMATTGAATHRTIYKGTHKLTSDELIEEALSTALSHIGNIDTAAHNIFLLLSGREREIE